MKPFATEELMARVRALLRRGTHRDAAVLRVNSLELDRTVPTVRRDGKVITLTPKEFSLLEYLMRRPGVVYTRSMIAEHVWDFTLELGRTDRASSSRCAEWANVLRDPGADQT